MSVYDNDEQLAGVCGVCHNHYALLANPAKKERHCPFCQVQVWPANQSPLPSLDDIVGFHVVRQVEWTGSTNYYEALQGNKRLLITLLEEGSTFQSSAIRFHEQGKDDPYSCDAIEPHPYLVRSYPIICRGKVAIASVDYIDGQPLGEWLHKVGPIDVPDAVGIVLKCLIVARHLGYQALGSRIHPQVIEICRDGEVKIAAYAGVLFTVFRDASLTHMMLDFDSEERVKRMNRFSPMGCQAPEYDSDLHQAAKVSAEQLREQKIYSLGGLLFELLADQKLPSVDQGAHLVKNLELVRADQLRPEAPRELADIMARMLAYNPAERYQSFDEVISALQSLHLAADKVSFIHRDGPPPDPAKQEAFAKRQWIHRESDLDFRCVRWGMTLEDVWKAEADVVDRAMPAAISVKTEYEGMQLSIVYQFVADGDEIVCVGAMISPEGLFVGRPRPKRSSITDKLGEYTRKRTQLNREERFNEASQLHPSHEDFMDADLNGLSGSLHSGNLDMDAVNETYEALKRLVSADYGQPKVVDGPLLEDLDMVPILAQVGGLDESEVVRGCRTSTWDSGATWACVSIRPSIAGNRMVTATVQSTRHNHLLPSSSK